MFACVCGGEMKGTGKGSQGSSSLMHHEDQCQIHLLILPELGAHGWAPRDAKPPWLSGPRRPTPGPPAPSGPRTWLDVAGELHSQGAAAQLGSGVGKVVPRELGSLGGSQQRGLGAALGSGGTALAAGPRPQAGQQSALQARAVAAGAVGGAVSAGAGLRRAPPSDGVRGAAGRRAGRRGGVRGGGRRLALRRPQRRGGVQEGPRRAAGSAAAAGPAAGRRGSLAAAGGAAAGLGAAASRAQQREADAEPAAGPPQPSPRHLRPRLQEKRGRGGSGELPLCGAARARRSLRPSPGCAQPRTPHPSPPRFCRSR